MSTDCFLFSPSRKRKVMIGSIGLGGVKVWPSDHGGLGFLHWAIEEHVTDIVLVDENDQRLDDDDIDRCFDPTIPVIERRRRV